MIAARILTISSIRSASQSALRPTPTWSARLNLSRTPTSHYSSSAAMVQGEALLKFTRVTNNAFAPSKGSQKAAGFDLRSAHDCVIPSRGSAIVNTDLKIELPEGCYGRIAPRSGLAAKNSIDVGAGVIDEDYRGEVKVVLFNFGDAAFQVAKGDRIAQLICEKIAYPSLVEIPNEQLSSTERGEGGFGSTGTN